MSHERLPVSLRGTDSKFLRMRPVCLALDRCVNPMIRPPVGIEILALLEVMG